MKNLLFAASLFLGATLAIACGGAPTEVQHEYADWNESSVNWLTYEQGIEQAAANGKPILLIFHTSWCPHCLNYSWMFHDPKVVALSMELNMVKVDRDENVELSDRYAPDGTYIPRTLALDPAGTLLPKIQGFDPEYPYFIDEYEPIELIAFMKRTANSGAGG